MLTQKIRIFPDKEEVLWFLSEHCRLLYNFALSERKTAWKENNESITYTMQQNQLPELKKKYSKYGMVYSKVLQMTLCTLDANFKSFFSLYKKGHKDARPPKYKGKKYFTTLKYNQSGFKLKKGYIQFSHKYKDTPLIFKIPEKFSFKKVKEVQIFQKKNQYYISITHKPTQKQYNDNGKYQAIDLGITKIVTAVNSKGRFLEVRTPLPDKYSNPTISKLQSRRDHCKKYSRNWYKLNKVINKLKQKQSNQIKDFQHKTSRKIIDNTRANTIIVGDLNVKGMAKSKNKGLNRATQNTGYLARFTKFLTYKAKLVGKKVIRIDERNTSKTCCNCGKIHDMKLYNRNMICECGNNLDRDKNSSINIMLRFLSQNGLWTAYQQFVDNLRQTVPSLDGALAGNPNAIAWGNSLHTNNCRFTN
ncbi:RNA-guided endonuclease TnpB family protein [Methanobacterium sp. SMA-27]|uniref:RNA-guided endonuclease InsQ/TnpB family protein n=1 Tax=Methanobacterium sp. SMA-27 TaxID=1495336 RepID=UPI000B139D48|nr:RNA-guided endonuclease TnpB family protein [Methanobacterium sp. SMA-27]